MTITLFSWGYWGWGNATEQLVEAVDWPKSDENSVRQSSSIFVCFAKGEPKGSSAMHSATSVGASRYRWMPDLGNLAVGKSATHEDKASRSCRRPAGTGNQAAKDRRRVIFYCACRFPRVNGKTRCHRDTVIDLAPGGREKAARSISVVEWPGGEPSVNRAIEVDRVLYRSVLNGRSNIPFRHERLGEFAGLPWGSILRSNVSTKEAFQFPQAQRTLLIEMAKAVWRLPVFLEVEKGDTRTLLAKAAKEWRQKCGLHERRFQG